MAGPNDPQVNGAEVRALLSYLTEHKANVDGALSLLICAFSVLAQQHNLKWAQAEPLIKDTFEKAKNFHITVVSEKIPIESQH